VTQDFSTAVREALVAAKDHAAQLSRLPAGEHRRLCEHLEARVLAVFEEAQAASDGSLRFHQKLDANGAAMICGLSVQRDAYAKTCLFVRIDATHLQTWWQLHEGGNLEHALGGWWNLPILAVEDQDAFLQARELDLVWTLRES
jgi:hypothetical protein